MVNNYLITESEVVTGNYYMADVCSRYNARSDWLSAASRQGIILP